MDCRVRAGRQSPRLTVVSPLYSDTKFREDSVPSLSLSLLWISLKPEPRLKALSSRFIEQLYKELVVLRVETGEKEVVVVESGNYRCTKHQKCHWRRGQGCKPIVPWLCDDSEST